MRRIRIDPNDVIITFFKSISEKYGLFAFFCLVTLVLLLIPPVSRRHFGYTQFNESNFISHLLFSILIAGLFTLFERYRHQNFITSNIHFKKYSFNQQIKRAKKHCKSKNLGIESYKNKLIIYNKYALIEYNLDEYYEFQCMELNDKQRCFKVSTTTGFKDIDIGFLEVLKQFSYDTKYNELIQFFAVAFGNENIYTDIENTFVDNPNKIAADEPVPTIEFNLSKVDINSANEEEIASLEGVNIVSAKKAVRYRDLKGGFKTYDEFFKAVDLKEKFIPKIRIRIEIGEYNTGNTIQINEGRILDI